MTDANLVDLIIAALLAMFIWNKIPAVIVAILVSLSFFALSIVTATDVLRGLGDPVVILIAALVVMGAGLEVSGVTTWAVQQLGQRAGRFVDPSQIATEHKANVIDVHPSRTFNSAAHRDKEIELLVEVRGPEVAVKMLEAIKAKGYEVTRHAAACALGGCRKQIHFKR
jgi:hypothetical protein